MKYLARSIALVTSIGLHALAAESAFAAGPSADELSQCLVRSTTSADKTLLVQWMFATAALHPDLRWMTTVTDSQRRELSKKAGKLMEDLLTRACVSDAREAVKQDGSRAIEASGRVLGQVAAQELFANPSVAGGLAELGKDVDQQKIQEALGLSK